MAKPILLGVDGEARELFIEDGQAGLYFEPENDAELVKQIRVLFNDRVLAAALGAQGQQFVKENFDRHHIHERFLKNL